MLLFLTPIWLTALAPLGVLGVVALRRQSAASVPLPTIRFWPRNENTGSGRQRRDWHWLPIVLAALLIPVALAAPTWRPVISSQRVAMHAAMRAIPGTTKSELFIRIERPEWIAPDEGISVIISDHEVTGPVLTQAVRAGMLETGMIFEEPVSDRKFIKLHGNDGLLAHRVLERKKMDSFAINARADSPLLERVLQIQPGFVQHARDTTRHLTIVDATSAQQTQHSPAAGECLIAIGRVPLNGVRYTGPDRTQAGAIQSTGKDGPLTNVDFGDAPVRRMVPAEFDAPWRVLAKASGLPFLAIRSNANGSRILWISTMDTDATTWPLHPSFVVFFTNLVNDWLASDTSIEPQWQVIPEPPSNGNAPIALSPYAGGAVLGCLIVGASMLITKK